ncbi:MAG: hypothetical protein KGN16_19290 [Burkholderiales bacterium]|nr:hypothetical protein [Burkholderiales bacterium]
MGMVRWRIDRGRPRQVWRITSEAPQGEYVESGAPRRGAPSADAWDSVGWVSSSHDLAAGLDVLESDDPAWVHVVDSGVEKAAGRHHED